jgi:hypothetical protein
MTQPNSTATAKVAQPAKAENPEDDPFVIPGVDFSRLGGLDIADNPSPQGNRKITNCRDSETITITGISQMLTAQLVQAILVFTQQAGCPN